MFIKDENRSLALRRKKFLFRASPIQISITFPWSVIFLSSKSLQKIEKLQECALRFLYNDHTSSYSDLLLNSDKCTMLISFLRGLCIEMFKTVEQLNPPFMQNISKLSTSCYFLRNPNDLAHVRPNAVLVSACLSIPTQMLKFSSCL